MEKLKTIEGLPSKTQVKEELTGLSRHYNSAHFYNIYVVSSSDSSSCRHEKIAAEPRSSPFQKCRKKASASLGAKYSNRPILKSRKNKPISSEAFSGEGVKSGASVEISSSGSSTDALTKIKRLWQEQIKPDFKSKASSESTISPNDELLPGCASDAECKLLSKRKMVKKEPNFLANSASKQSRTATYVKGLSVSFSSSEETVSTLYNGNYSCSYNTSEIRHSLIKTKFDFSKSLSLGNLSINSLYTNNNQKKIEKFRSVPSLFYHGQHGVSYTKRDDFCGSRASDTAIVAARKKLEKEKNTEILSPLLKHKRNSFHVFLNEDIEPSSNIAKSKKKIPENSGYALTTKGHIHTSNSDNAIAKYTYPSGMPGVKRQSTKKRTGLEVTYSNQLYPSTGENLYDKKGMYMSTVQKMLPDGSPVVLIGHVQDSSGISRKVVILATLKQRRDSKPTSFISGSGDSVATLPSHQIPGKIELYTEKMVTPKDCLKSSDSTLCADCPHREGIFDQFLKQASNMFGKLLWGKKASSSLDLLTSESNGSNGICTDYKQSKEIHGEICEEQNDLVSESSSHEQTHACEQTYVCEQSGPLTIGRNRQVCEQTCCDLSSESSSESEKLAEKMKHIRNDIEATTEGHVNSLKAFPESIYKPCTYFFYKPCKRPSTFGTCLNSNPPKVDSAFTCDQSPFQDSDYSIQNCYNDDFLNDLTDAQCIKYNGCMVKQHLKSLRSTRPDLEDTDDKNDYSCSYNATPARNSEEESSSESNAGFYNKLSTMVKSWVERGLQRYVHPSIFDELQDANHYYHEVSSNYCKCAPNETVCQNYNRLCERENLLTDTESAKFTEETDDSVCSSNQKQEWKKAYCVKNYKVYDCYSEPVSIPCVRVGASEGQNQFVPHPSAVMSFQVNAKKISGSISKRSENKLVHVGKHQRPRPFSINPNENVVPSSLEISEKTNITEDVGEKDCKCESINVIMSEITESLFHILPSRRDVESRLLSSSEQSYSDASLNHIEYSWLYSVNGNGARRSRIQKRDKKSKFKESSFDTYSKNKDMHQMHKMLSYISEQACADALTVRNQDTDDYCMSVSVPANVKNFFQESKAQIKKVFSSTSLNKNKLLIGIRHSKDSVKHNNESNESSTYQDRKSCKNKAQIAGKQRRRKAKRSPQSRKLSVYEKLVNALTWSKVVKELLKTSAKSSKNDGKMTRVKRKRVIKAPEISAGPNYDMSSSTTSSNYKDDITYEYPYSEITHSSSTYSETSTKQLYDIKVNSNSENYSSINYEPLTVVDCCEARDPAQHFDFGRLQPHKKSSVCQKASELPGFPGSIRIPPPNLGRKQHVSKSILNTVHSKCYEQTNDQRNDVSALSKQVQNDQLDLQLQQVAKQEKTLVKSSHNKNSKYNKATNSKVNESYYQKERNVKAKHFDVVEKHDATENSDVTSSYVPLWHKGKWRKEKLLPAPTSNKLEKKGKITHGPSRSDDPKSKIRQLLVANKLDVIDQFVVKESYSSSLGDDARKSMQTDFSNQSQESPISQDSESQVFEKLPQTEAVPYQSNLNCTIEKLDKNEVQSSLDISNGLSTISSLTSSKIEKSISAENCKENLDRVAIVTAANSKVLRKSFSTAAAALSRSASPKCLQGQYAASSEKRKQSFCASQALPSTVESVSSNSVCKIKEAHFPKDLLKLGAMDYSSTNISMVSSWWEGHGESSLRTQISAEDSLPPCLDSDEEEIRARFNQFEAPLPVVSTRTAPKTEFRAKAALLYLRGDGLLMSQYLSKSTAKLSKSSSSRKYGMSYPSLEDIHCLQTVGRLQTSSVTSIYRSHNLRLICNDPQCIYVRSVSSDVDLNKHLPVRNWRCCFPSEELSVSLNETKLLLEKGLKTMHSCAEHSNGGKLNESKGLYPSGLTFKPFFPQLYEKRVLMPLASSLVKSAIRGGKDIYRRTFADLYQKQADDFGEDLATRSFQKGIANCLIRNAMNASRIEIQAEVELEKALTKPIRGIIDEVIAAEYASKIIARAKRFVIIDNYIKQRSPHSTAASVTSVTDINISALAETTDSSTSVQEMQGSLFKTNLDAKRIGESRNEPKSNTIRFKAPRIYNMPVSSIPKASIGSIRKWSQANARFALIKHEVKNLLNDLVGAVSVSEELQLNAFSSKPAADLAYNVSQSISKEKLVTKTSAHRIKITKSPLRVISDIEEEIEFIASDCDKSNAVSHELFSNPGRYRGKINRRQVIQLPRSRDNIELLRELRHYSSTDVLSSCSSSSYHCRIPVKRSRLPYSIQKFINETYCLRKHRPTRERNSQLKHVKAAATFKENHLVRWKRVTNSYNTSESTLPCLPSSELSYEAHRQSRMGHNEFQASTSSQFDIPHIIRSQKESWKSAKLRPSSCFFTKSLGSVSITKKRKTKKKSKVFGHTPKTLIKKFGNIVKRFAMNYSSSSQYSSSESNYKTFTNKFARSPYPSAKNKKEELSSESDYVIFEIVSGSEGCSNTNSNSSIANSSFTSLSTCESKVETPLAKQATKDETCHRNLECFDTRSQCPKNYSKVPEPAGMSQGSYHSKSIDSYSNYSSYKLSNSASRILNDVSEAVYSDSDSSITTYEYSDESSSTDSSIKEQKSTPKWSRASSFYSGSSCQKSLSRQNVSLGNRSQKKPSKSESLQSIPSIASSFLDRKYNALTFKQKVITQPITKQTKDVMIYAATQTIHPTSSKPAQTISSTPLHCQELKSNSDEHQRSHESKVTKNLSNSTVKTLWKISDESLKKILNENQFENQITPSAGELAVDHQRNTRKLAPHARAPLPQPTMLLENTETNPMSTKSEKAVVSEKPLDSSGLEQSYSDQMPRSSPTLRSEKCVDELNQNNSKHQSCRDFSIETEKTGINENVTPRRGIKKLLNELNKEMNGVREVVSSPNCEVKPSISLQTKVDVPQVSKGLSNLSASEQLSLMLSDLQRSLINFVAELANNNQIIQVSLPSQKLNKGVQSSTCLHVTEHDFESFSSSDSARDGFARPKFKRRSKQILNKVTKRSNKYCCGKASESKHESKQIPFISVSKEQSSSYPAHPRPLFKSRLTLKSNAFRKRKYLIEQSNDSRNFKLHNYNEYSASHLSHASSSSSFVDTRKSVVSQFASKFLNKNQFQEAFKCCKDKRKLGGCAFENDYENFPHPSCRTKRQRNSATESPETSSCGEEIWEATTPSKTPKQQKKLDISDSQPANPAHKQSILSHSCSIVPKQNSRESISKLPTCSSRNGTLSFDVNSQLNHLENDVPVSKRCENKHVGSRDQQPTSAKKSVNEPKAKSVSFKEDDISPGKSMHFEINSSSKINKDLSFNIGVADLRSVDKSALEQANKVSNQFNYTTAHLRANQPNDSIQLTVPELTDVNEAKSNKDVSTSSDHLLTSDGTPENTKISAKQTNQQIMEMVRSSVSQQQLPQSPTDYKPFVANKKLSKATVRLFGLPKLNLDEKSEANDESLSFRTTSIGNIAKLKNSSADKNQLLPPKSMVTIGKRTFVDELKSRFACKAFSQNKDAIDCHAVADYTFQNNFSAVTKTIANEQEQDYQKMDIRKDSLVAEFTISRNDDIRSQKVFVTSVVDQNISKIKKTRTVQLEDDRLTTNISNDSRTAGFVVSRSQSPNFVLTNSTTRRYINTKTPAVAQEVENKANSPTPSAGQPGWNENKNAISKTALLSSLSKTFETATGLERSSQSGNLSSSNLDSNYNGKIDPSTYYNEKKQLLQRADSNEVRENTKCRIDSSFKSGNRQFSSSRLSNQNPNCAVEMHPSALAHHQNYFSFKRRSRANTRESNALSLNPHSITSDFSQHPRKQSRRFSSHHSKQRNTDSSDSRSRRSIPADRDNKNRFTFPYFKRRSTLSRIEQKNGSSSLTKNSSIDQRRQSRHKSFDQRRQSRHKSYDRDDKSYDQRRQSRHKSFDQSRQSRHKSYDRDGNGNHFLKMPNRPLYHERRRRSSRPSTRKQRHRHRAASASGHGLFVEPSWHSPDINHLSQSNSSVDDQSSPSLNKVQFGDDFATSSYEDELDRPRSARKPQKRLTINSNESIHFLSQRGSTISSEDNMLAKTDSRVFDLENRSDFVAFGDDDSRFNRNDENIGNKRREPLDFYFFDKNKIQQNFSTQVYPGSNARHISRDKKSPDLIEYLPPDSMLPQSPWSSQRISHDYLKRLKDSSVHFSNQFTSQNFCNCLTQAELLKLAKKGNYLCKKIRSSAASSQKQRFTLNQCHMDKKAIQDINFLRGFVSCCQDENTEDTICPKALDILCSQNEDCLLENSAFQPCTIPNCVHHATKEKSTQHDINKRCILYDSCADNGAYHINELNDDTQLRDSDVPDATNESFCSTPTNASSQLTDESINLACAGPAKPILRRLSSFSTTRCALGAIRTTLDFICRAVAAGAILYFLLHEPTDSVNYAPI